MSVLVDTDYTADITGSRNKTGGV